MNSNIFSLNKEQYERAEQVYKKSIVIDCLNYIPGDDLTGIESYFKKLIEYGVTAVHITVAPPYAGYLSTMDHIGVWLRTLGDLKDLTVLVTSVDDILTAKETGRVGVIMGLQNLKCIDDDLGKLTILKQLGLRILQVAYQEQNLLGEGCAERTDSGLSNLGIEAVHAIEKMGLLTDISHCNTATTNDVLEYAKGTVVATHANPKDLTNDHIRNKTNDGIKKIAETDGVIGLNAWSGIGQVREEVRPTIENLLDFVDYMVELTSVDHVGLGSDFCPMWNGDAYNEFRDRYPELCPFEFEEAHAEGLSNAGEIFNLAQGLVARGYSDESIQKILGGNFLRVFKQVWK